MTVAPVRVPLYIASIQNFLKYTVLDVDYGLQTATWKKSLQNHEQKALTSRPVRTSSSTMLYERPYLHTHTHMHTHTSITLYAPTLHSTCTYAAVLHAVSIQIAHHAFLYQNAYDSLTHTLTHPHSHLHSHSHHNAHRHKRNLTRNHFTTLANQQQEQSQSHSHPLL